MKIIKYFIGVFLLCIIHIGIGAPQVITLQKGDKTVSLFGTIHITKKEFFPLPNNVTDTLKQADALVEEINLTDSQTMLEMMQYMTTKGKTSDIDLSAALSFTEKEKLRTILGSQTDAMMQMRPWIIATAVLVERAKKWGFTDKSVDTHLAELATAQQKTVLGLEKPSEQFSIFEKLSKKERLAFLRDSLIADDEFREAFQKTIQVWQNDDPQAAKILFDEFKKKMPHLYDAMFTQRNIKMAQGIEKYNQQYQHLMVAVGALHLHGDGSVIELLRASGYR